MELNADAKTFLNSIKDKPVFESLPVAEARNLFREINSLIHLLKKNGR